MKDQSQSKSPSLQCRCMLPFVNASLLEEITKNTKMIQIKSQPDLSGIIRNQGLSGSRSNAPSAF